jgi:hypothetical protein
MIVIFTLVTSRRDTQRPPAPSLLSKLLTKKHFFSCDTYTDMNPTTAAAQATTLQDLQLSMPVVNIYCMYLLEILCKNNYILVLTIKIKIFLQAKVNCLFWALIFFPLFSLSSVLTVKKARSRSEFIHPDLGLFSQKTGGINSVTGHFSFTQPQPISTPYPTCKTFQLSFREQQFFPK